MKTIAIIKTDFPEKFGIPRQSGRIDALKGTVIFMPKYKSPDAVKGLEGFSHIWLLWKFDVPQKENFQATVRPPRLGGNTPMGVFATRSPFRPNPIGLSCVKLEKIEITKDGPVLHVSGVDMKNDTEILDIKPYIPYTDCREDAIGGFADSLRDYHLDVNFPEDLLKEISPEKREALLAVLADDPRPSYQDDPDRLYGISFAGFDIRFTVSGTTLTVHEVN
ncbi:MAG: tRNA (N6-threonylcarbamoyladenosine(37)-N6)-methyltransferase TrmO [Lachnospiraceae bacterium]|nr:tRNA (N6-threonylcarbamoyladenosine(37)-N6)-methyltransferase TrmO [Lachnospiraceae bacterium]